MAWKRAFVALAAALVGAVGELARITATPVPHIAALHAATQGLAHKLAADRGSDFRVHRTDRYRLAEALAGVPGLEAGWALPWRGQHVLLLTAPPHMGKEYPWFALWRLLDPWVFTTPRALAAYPFAQRRRYFLRRVSENRRSRIACDTRRRDAGRHVRCSFAETD